MDDLRSASGRWPNFGGDVHFPPRPARGEGPERDQAQPTIAPPSGIDTIDGMLSGLMWGSTTLTFSFPTDPSFYEGAGGYADGAEQDQNFEALNPTQQQVVTALFATIADVTNLTFTLITESQTEHSDLRFGMSDAAEVAYAYLPTSDSAGGDVWFNNTGAIFDAPALGGYAYLGVLHEIGHALGLDHPFDPSIYGAIPLGWDSTEFTVMTYRSAIGSDLAGYTNADFSFPQTLMMLDIAALQYMYGADFTYNATDTTYTFSETTGEMFVNGAGQGTPGANTIFRTIWDGGGNDTYDFSNYTVDLVVDLEPGYSTTLASEQLPVLDPFNEISAIGSVFNALLFQNDARSLIENAIGGDGDDIFFGNSANNTFIGGYGADYFVADLGADTYIGGSVPPGDVFGTDLVSYELSTTAVTINTRTGVNAGAIAIGDTYQLIDGFVGSGYNDTLIAYGFVFGYDGNDSLTGYDFNDTLDGGEGDDILFSTPGEDDFIGGGGRDTVSYANLAVALFLDLSSGNHGNGDEFRDSFSGIEIFVGTPIADQMIGNGAANTFDGGGGNDNLQGGGGDDILMPGSGANTVNGGSGNDIVSYANVSTFLGGITLRVSPITFKFGEVSDDTLTSIEGIIGTNAGDWLEMDNNANYIDGGGGDDTLRGFAGNDTMYGGAGVDDINSGNDTDLVYGGDGNDLINGSGGNDTLYGETGNDAINGSTGIDASAYALASTSATWARNIDGTWAITAGVNGADTLTSIEFLDFTDRDVFLDRASQTFSGNGTSDVLFRRDDGIMASWEVTGSTINSASFLPTAGAEWMPRATGDVSGDGRDDVIWQRNDGLVYAWLMNGGAVSSAVALTGIGAEWTFLGMGDFNGDLTDDFAWQRNDGLVYTWTMANAAIASANAITGLGAEWALEGFGDFNSDGRDDFLWRRTDTGEMAIWQMNGAIVQGGGATSLQASLGWSIVGVGDTNGDGSDDIVMQRASDGMISVWAMNGATVLSTIDAGAANPAEWSVRDIGDYNGDGRDDILWQHDDGTVYAWFLNGASIIGAGGLSGVGAEWTIIGGG